MLARLPGLEPGASGLGGSRSILLSYRRMDFPRPVCRTRNYFISFGAALSRGLSVRGKRRHFSEKGVVIAAGV